MDKDYEDKGSQTEFNSNVATLQRINDLIVEIHRTALGMFPQNKIRGFHQLDLIDRLFIEAQTKMLKAELDVALGFQNKINSLIKKHGAILYSKGNKSQTYFVGWRDITSATREYEIFLMKTLDSHGMLMSEMGTGMQRFRGIK